MFKPKLEQQAFIGEFFDYFFQDIKNREIVKSSFLLNIIHKRDKKTLFPKILGECIVKMKTKARYNVRGYDFNSTRLEEH